MALCNRASTSLCLFPGYSATAFDMRLLKNLISMLGPNVYPHISSTNEKHTERDIGYQGQRLAMDIAQFALEWEEFACNEPILSVSFVGHSLGGLIARCSLPYLPGSPRSKLNIYMRAFLRRT